MRPDDWEDILLAHVGGRTAMSFAWGGNDCVSAIADLGVAMGEPDLLNGMRGYKTERGALLKLRRNGYGDVLDLCRDRLAEIPLGLMGRADIGFVPNPTVFGGGIGVFDGRELCGIGFEGHQRMARGFATAAFRWRGW